MTVKNIPNQALVLPDLAPENATVIVIVIETGEMMAKGRRRDPRKAKVKPRKNLC